MEQVGERIANASVEVGPQPASQLCGRLVHDRHGAVVGSIAELRIDLERGCVTHALVATGGFLGLGERRFAVPWRALRSTGHGFVLGDADDDEQTAAPPQHWSSDLG